MWFADIGVGMAWLAIVGWVLVAALAVALPRFGRSTPALLLTAPTRTPLLVGAGAVVLLFAAQAGVVDTVADSTGAGLLDRWVWAWFVAHRTPALDQLMITVSTVGNTVGMAVLALIGAAVLWRLRRRPEAALVVIAAVGSSLLITGFKNLYGRDRPPVAQRLTVETNAALPSGHSLGSVVVLGVRGCRPPGTPTGPTGAGGCRGRRGDRRHRHQPPLPGRALDDRRPDRVAPGRCVAGGVRHRHGGAPAPPIAHVAGRVPGPRDRPLMITGSGQGGTEMAALAPL